MWLEYFPTQRWKKTIELEYLRPCAASVFPADVLEHLTTEFSFAPPVWSVTGIMDSVSSLKADVNYCGPYKSIITEYAPGGTPGPLTIGILDPTSLKGDFKIYFNQAPEEVIGVYTIIVDMWLEYFTTQRWKKTIELEYVCPSLAKFEFL